MAPQGVIFDIDGTLVDSVDLHARSWQEAFAKYGHDIDFARIRSQIGKGGDQLMPVFLSHDELARIGPALEADRSALFKDKYLHEIRAFPGVRSLFARIAAAGSRSSRIPAKRISPPAMRPGGSSRPMMAAPVSDFPAPLSPTTPSTSPAAISKDTWSSARRVPRRVGNSTVRLRTASRAITGAAG